MDIWLVTYIFDGREYTDSVTALGGDDAQYLTQKQFGSPIEFIATTKEN